MKRTSLYHAAPRTVKVVEESLSPPGPGQALVIARSSAISAGTELLYYRGQVEKGTALDVNIPSLRGGIEYPFKYGYASIGRVTEIGEGTDASWVGARVFAFHAHESAFVAPIEELIRLPDVLENDDALFYASMETAASIAMDAKPLIGEDVVVIGQGIIGLLTTAVLSRHPLGTLVTVDSAPSRRGLSRELGAGISLDPNLGAEGILRDAGIASGRADLVVELSGNPDALNLALSLVGHEGRVVVGSWYGTKAVRVNLGTEFHRGRVRLIGSQVSTLGPSLTGRWDKRRRYDLVARLLSEARPSRLITHRFELSEAARAFALLDTGWEGIGQVVLDYPGGEG
ncbi:MAG TPA: zinc-binding alcohol dehydrogenase [Methanomassiliicoccales archaeon]|nr:zinc-binding alcohol dehydrogenase [Methanomassiliicoccales archaeon]